MKKQSIVVAVLCALNLSLQALSLPVDTKKKNAEKKEKSEKKVEAKEHKALLREETRLARGQRAKLMQKWRKVRKGQSKQEFYDGKFADLYVQPTWPLHALFFERPTSITVTTDYRAAHHGFDNEGHTDNLAELVFGSKKLKVRDILIDSALIEDGFAEYMSPDPDNQFLSYLAPIELRLDAQKESWDTTLTLVRYLRKNSVAVGVQLPISNVHHTFKVTPTLTFREFEKMTRTIIEPLGTDFRFLYGGDFDRFFDDILKRKCMTYKKGQSTTGIGNVNLFGHFLIDTSLCERLLVGARYSAPTAKERDEMKLWGPEISNAGFAQVQLFGSMLCALDYKVNPHFFVQFSWSPARTVSRRVPRYVTFNGDRSTITTSLDGPKITDFILFPERVMLLEGSGFKKLDTKLRHFSDRSERVKIMRGMEVQFRVGNVFEKFIFRRAYLDLFYDGHFKRKDELRNVGKDYWFTDLIEQNTSSITHRIGADYSYQFDHGTRMHGGLVYTFAGRNTLEEFAVYAQLTRQF